MKKNAHTARFEVRDSCLSQIDSRESLPTHHEELELVRLNFARVIDLAENNTSPSYYYLDSVCNSNKYKYNFQSNNYSLLFSPSCIIRPGTTTMQRPNFPNVTQPSQQSGTVVQQPQQIRQPNVSQAQQGPGGSTMIPQQQQPRPNLPQKQPIVSSQQQQNTVVSQQNQPTNIVSQQSTTTTMVSTQQNQQPMVSTSQQNQPMVSTQQNQPNMVSQQQTNVMTSQAHPPMVSQVSSTTTSSWRSKMINDSKIVSEPHP